MFCSAVLILCDSNKFLVMSVLWDDKKGFWQCKKEVFVCCGAVRFKPSRLSRFRQYEIFMEGKKTRCIWVQMKSVSFGPPQLLSVFSN